MKLKECYINLIDKFQLIRVKEWEPLNTDAVLLKVKLGIGFWGLSKHFKTFEISIPETPERVEEKLRNYAGINIFKKKIVMKNSKLTLENTSSSILRNDIYNDMAILMQQNKELERLAIRDRQTADFLEQPGIKQYMTISKLVSKHVGSFMNRQKSFAGGQVIGEPLSLGGEDE